MNLSPQIQTQFRKAWANGDPLTTIAKALGWRSATTCSQVAKRLKLPSRRPNLVPHKVTDELRATIRDCYGKELTLDLARRLGVSRQVVVAVAKDEGCDMTLGRTIAQSLMAGQRTSRTRPRAWRCDCGRRNGSELECPGCQRPAAWKPMVQEGLLA